MKKETIVKALMESTREYGLVATLGQVFGNTIQVNVGFTQSACDTGIEELALSVRSYNALRRANVTTLGDLVAKLNEGTVKNIRNLGAKSYSEIQTKMLVYGFEQLSEKGKGAFFDNLIENNVIESSMRIN